MGESFGRWTLGDDEAILPYVSSVNIACGFHAGDPATMMKTIALAQKHQVHIGAHPGFADLQGFGRREMQHTPQEVYELMVYQIGALSACAKVRGVALHHVKPHGALYNMAARDPKLAEAIADAIYAVDPQLILYGLSGSALISEGQKKGLQVYNEVFADRTYQADGSLTPRSASHAVIKDAQLAIAQVIQMVRSGRVTAIDGTTVPIQADTLCIHGDHPTAVTFAEDMAQALHNQVISIR